MGCLVEDSDTARHKLGHIAGSEAKPSLTKLSSQWKGFSSNNSWWQS